jgi:hypothetical protein
MAKLSARSASAADLAIRIMLWLRLGLLRCREGKRRMLFLPQPWTGGKGEEIYE